MFGLFIRKKDNSNLKVRSLGGVRVTDLPPSVKEHIKKPKVVEEATVEEIHSAVDSLEEKTNNHFNKILKELKIPTESQLTDKAKLMKKLGFNASNETIRKAENVLEKIEEAHQIKTNTVKSLNYFKAFKEKYPDDKILALDKFLEILDKYGLIYSSLGNYIKDVPEKNLLELEKAKELHYTYGAIFEERYISKIELRHPYRVSDVYVELNNKLFLEMIGKLDKSLFLIENYEELKNICKTWLLKKSKEYQSSIVFNDYDVVNSPYRHCDFLISAPKSHFNLSNFTTWEKIHVLNDVAGSITVESVKESKDPIVFQLLIGGFVRIITKWGTDDDQSYLDPEIV